jgi:hypothetical protein
VNISANDGTITGCMRNVNVTVLPLC